MASDAPLAPNFIQFLFSTKPKFDCYFEVGNKSQGKPERIGAVKLMLMAHSEVFRLELEDSDLKEKNDVPVKDIHPDTFKGMLKYVYGHDTTSDLCFDEADNLLYVAEKYMMKTLKDKLAVRLMKLLSPDNICSLLNNPACYTHLELNSAITEILRFETAHVLASPQFLWMNPDGFLKILEQDGLAVQEIELWRAAIKWAKHRANSEDGQMLRLQLSGLTQHLRLCTLNADEILQVIPTGVLTLDEVSTVCKSVRRKRKPEDLPEISDEIIPRKRLRQNEINLTNFVKRDVRLSAEYNFTLTTRKRAIELLPLVCLSRKCYCINPEKSTHKVTCTTEITKIGNLEIPGTDEPPTTVSFSEDVQCGEEFEIPLNITLLPNSNYTIKMELNGDHQRYYNLSNGISKNHHLKLDFTTGAAYFFPSGAAYFLPSGAEYFFPSTKLSYRITRKG